MSPNLPALNHLILKHLIFLPITRTHQTDLLHSDGLCAVARPLLPASLWGLGGARLPGQSPRLGQLVKESHLLANAQLGALVVLRLWLTLGGLGLVRLLSLRMTA